MLNLRVKTFLLMSVMIVCLSGCVKNSSTTDTPSRVEWGKRGTAPEQVWGDFDWIIKDIDLELE